MFLMLVEDNGNTLRLPNKRAKNPSTIYRQSTIPNRD